MSVDDNIIFDPSKDELAVADAVLAISAGQATGSDGGLTTLALRTIDPPSRLTAPGVPNSQNSASGGAAVSQAEALVQREVAESLTVWRPPRGGVKRALIGRMVKMVVERGGVGQEVMDGLRAVET